MSRSCYFVLRLWNVTDDGVLCGNLEYVSPNILPVVSHAGAEMVDGNPIGFGYFQALEDTGISRLVFNDQGRLVSVEAHMGGIKADLLRELTGCSGAVKGAIKSMNERLAVIAGDSPGPISPLSNGKHTGNEADNKMLDLELARGKGKGKGKAS